MKVLLIFLLGFYSCSSAFAQNAKDSLFLLLSESVKEEEKATLYSQIGWKHYPNSPDSMQFYFSQAIANSKKPNLIASAERGIGVAFYLLTDYEKAAAQSLKALEIFQAEGNLYGVGKCYNSLGLNFSSRKNYQTAVEYHWKSMGIALKLIETLQDEDSLLLAKEMLGHNYINLIVSYEISPQKDSTLYYIEKSIDWFTALQDSFYLAMSYSRKANALYTLQQYDEAIEINRFVNTTFRNLSQFEKVFTWLGIAQNSLELGNIKQSIEYALMGYTLAKKIEANWHLQHLTRVLAKGYALQGNYAEAYQYHTEYKSVSDTLFSQESEKRINYLLLKQKDLENAQLVQENRLKEEELTVKNQQILLVLGGLGLIILLLVVQYRNSQKLKALNNQLNETNATKDKFFSIIAHDLRSPFNAMNDFLQMFQQGVTEWSEQELRDFSGLMLSSVSNVSKLLENLLEWASLQTNRLNFNPQDFSINELIEENNTVLNQIAEKKQIQLKQLSKGETIVHADRNMVSTVLRNLINNALKFTEKGGEVTIEHEPVMDGKLKVTVSDTGRGIAASVLSKLFNVSEKHSTKGAAQEEGTGLGLVLCKEFIEKHGGALTVESTEGKGSAFSFTLPIQ